MEAWKRREGSGGRGEKGQRRKGKEKSVFTIVWGALGVWGAKGGSVTVSVPRASSEQSHVQGASAC